MARCEASEGEALRYKQRVEHQDRELKDLQEAVNTEREKMQVGNERMERLCSKGNLRLRFFILDFHRNFKLFDDTFPANCEATIWLWDNKTICTCFRL